MFYFALVTCKINSGFANISNYVFQLNLKSLTIRKNAVLNVFAEFQKAFIAQQKENQPVSIIRKKPGCEDRKEIQ